MLTCCNPPPTPFSSALYPVFLTVYFTWKTCCSVVSIQGGSPILSPYFETFMEPRNRFQGMNSSSLCSLAGRYDNPIPTRFLAPIDCLKFQLCFKGLGARESTHKSQVYSTSHKGEHFKGALLMPPQRKLKFIDMHNNLFNV